MSDEVLFEVVQRLFSMFPAGRAGLGLLVLRLSATAMLVDPSIQPTATLPLWALGTLVAIGILICIGGFTPASCIASALAQLAMLLSNQNGDLHFFEVAFSLGVTSALFLLGPGAFSVDGRLFGRRLILPSDSE